MSAVAPALHEGNDLLIVRRASGEDVLDILRWRNDELTRSMSRNDNFIDEARHRIWYAKALVDPGKLLLIGLQAGQKIGMVRFDRRDSLTWEVNIALAPEARGKGLGNALLKTAFADFFSIHAEILLLAEVKQENTASHNLFKSLGFALDSGSSDIVQYTLHGSNWIAK